MAADHSMNTCVFGPVPSRRLGRSLGINNIPPKACTYSCVYCQLGRTIHLLRARRSFYDPQAIAEAVSARVDQVRRRGGQIDYLTFVPDGEPTLDANLGREVELLRPLGLPIAIISNSSLLWLDDVRRELAAMDWVCLKVDAARQETWHKINRPHRSLDLEAMLDGILTFAAEFTGRLVTETMLVRGLNDSRGEVENVGLFLAAVKPSVAYLAIPTRPPAERWVASPDEETLHQAYQVLRQFVDRVEFLTAYEGTEFLASGDAERDLLSITSVHPMREDAVQALLQHQGEGWETVERLLQQGRLVKLTYGGATFYMRRLRQQQAGRNPTSPGLP